MIIFINGSLNAGKSTIAELLKNKITNTAIVEVDKLRNFVDWLPLEESIPLNLKNTSDIIKNFAKAGINAVIPYPLSQRNYDFLMGELKDFKDKIYVFTLSPDLETALSDRGERKLDEQEKERIKYHYKIRLHQPIFGKIINNTNQTPEQTADKILSNIS